MPFTESNYENAVLQLFTQILGYSYAYGPDIQRDYHSPLYEDELLPALRLFLQGKARRAAGKDRKGIQRV